jgi:hypothetical protein
VLGNVPLRTDLRRKRLYAREAGAIEQYILMTASAGAVPYEEAREYDEHRHYDKDTICAIALGTQQVARVRSPDEREAALRVQNAEKWATRRHITTCLPSPLNDGLMTQALNAARLLAGRVLTRDAELRLIWDDAPDNGATLRKLIASLQQALGE